MGQPEGGCVGGGGFVGRATVLVGAAFVAVGGALVSVGGATVLVAGIAVAVGGIVVAVAVGGTTVFVGGTRVAEGGIGVAVEGTAVGAKVDVAGAIVGAGGIGVLLGAQAKSINKQVIPKTNSVSKRFIQHLLKILNVPLTKHWRLYARCKLGSIGIHDNLRFTLDRILHSRTISANAFVFNLGG